MIDILLVLLIIFMMITPPSPHGFDAAIPQPAKRELPQPDASLVITVTGGNTVRLNDEPIELAALHDRLLVIFRSAPDRPLFLRADPNLEFQQIAQVIDIAKGAGMNRMGLMPR
jgi:biopolymer transport protein TolR